MQIKFYPKSKGAKLPVPLFAQISYNYNRPKLYTDLSILPVKWDHKNQCAKPSMVGAPEFNLRLINYKERIQQCFHRFLLDHGNAYPTPTELKKLLYIEFKKKLPADMAAAEQLKSFFGYFRHFLDQSEKGTRKTKQGGKISKNTISNYYSLQAVLVEFEKHRGKKITFDCIDLEFYADFMQYLERSKKYKKNTIQTQFRILKTVMSDGLEAGHHNNTRYASKKFAAGSEDISSVYLSEAELSELSALDLSGSQRLEKVRDLFLISCYTGLRFSDLHQVTSKNIAPDHLHPRNLYLTIKQVKTHEEVVIPINKIVKAIIAKYDNQLPAPISNQKTNEFLKEICGKVDKLKAPTEINFTKGGLKVIETRAKYQLITTHTARRSFATNAYMAGHQSKNIMAVTGHKTEKSFNKYIRVTAMEKARLFKQHSDKKTKLKAV